MPEALVAGLWEQFADRLRRFIATRVDDHASAEDVLQDVFLKVQRGVGAVRDTEQLTTWMFRVTNNAIIDHYRAAPRRREVPVEGTEGIGQPAESALIDEQVAVRAQISECLRPLIAQLPDIQREALELVDLDGMSQTEAARRLGLTVSGMKSRVQRARAAALERLRGACAIATDARGGPLECLPTSEGACE